MANQIINDYILSARKSGFTDSQIELVLANAGWDANQIHAAFFELPDGGVIYDEDKVREKINAWLKAIFKSQLVPILILGVIGIAASVVVLLEPWPLKLLTDSVFGDQPAPGYFRQYTGTPTLLYIVAISMVVLFVVKQMIELLDTYLREKFVFNIDQKIRSDFFAHVLRLPLAYKGKLQSSDYVFRQNDEANEISDLVINAPIVIATNLFTIIATLFVMFQINAGMTALTLLVVPPIYFATRYFSDRIEGQSLKAEEAAESVFTHSTESIENAGLIQSFGKIRFQTQRLIERMHVRFQETLKLNLLDQYLQAATGGVVIIATLGVVLLGGNQIFDGNLTFGELLVFIIYLGNFFVPVQSLVQGIADFRQSYAVIARVYEVLDDHRNVDKDEEVGKAINGFTNEITFQNATILREDTRVLNDVNITIKKGMRVGLIGSSGSGKSTLMGSVTRTVDHAGFIGVDGVDVKDININSLRALFSSVQQSPGLFSDTIYNNIVYGIDVEPTHEHVVGAARAADAHDFIMQLPEQYQTDIGEAGAFLSGGQLQRIALARAFLRDAPILLMDEPTSALDVESEKHVMQTIYRLMKNRTVIVISHKLSLLSQMDMVLVVEGGRVMDVKAYGGFDKYIEYLRVHELV